MAANEPESKAIATAITTIDQYLKQGWSITYQISNQPALKVTSIVNDPRTSDSKPVKELRTQFESVTDLYLWVAAELSKYIAKTAKSIAKANAPVQALLATLDNPDPLAFRTQLKKLLVNAPSSKGYPNNLDRPKLGLDKSSDDTLNISEIEMAGDLNSISVRTTFEEAPGSYDYWHYRFPVDSLKMWLIREQWNDDTNALLKLIADRSNNFKDSELVDANYVN